MIFRFLLGRAANSQCASAFGVPAVILVLRPRTSARIGENALVKFVGRSLAIGPGLLLMLDVEFIRVRRRPGRGLHGHLRFRFAIRRRRIGTAACFFPFMRLRLLT